MMRLFRRINRDFRDALRSVIRNFSLSIASISCITITLIVVSLSMVLSLNVENFTESIRKDVTVVIFLNNNVTEEETKQIEKQIYDTKNVSSLSFKTKEQTASEFGKENPAFESIVNSWENGENPLFDSFMLKVDNIEKIEETVDQIRKIEGVNSINYGEEIVRQLIVVFKVIEKSSIWAVVALVLVTSFLISNTIKLTIYSRKTEIEIMRLVGASNSAIKMPFVIEGLFLGIIGAILPIGLTIYGYIALYDFFDGKMFGSPLAKLITPSPFVYQSSLLLLLIGILVGMFGSYRAVRKYLKI